MLKTPDVKYLQLQLCIYIGYNLYLKVQFMLGTPPLGRRISETPPYSTWNFTPTSSPLKKSGKPYFKFKFIMIIA